MNRRNVLITVFAILTAMFAGLNLLAWNHAATMLHYVPSGTRTAAPEDLTWSGKLHALMFGIRVPRPEGLPAPPPGWQSAPVETRDGVMLETWLSAPEGSRTLVVLFHGYSAEKSSLLAEAEAFRDLGCAVMLVDFRGSGGSSESYCSVGIHEAEDVRAVYSHVQSAGDWSRIVLYGHSMGAVSILRAVHEYQIQPDGVILEAVFDTLLNTVRNRFHAMNVPAFPAAELLVFWGGRQLKFNGFTHQPVRYASALSCPSLWLHGEKDPRATLDQGRRVFDAALGPKRFVTFEESGHTAGLATDEARWTPAVKDFLGG